MRQLDPVTNLVLAVLASLGLLATLSTPWFAAPASSTTPTDGPVEKAAWQVGHFFGTSVKGRVSGSDAIGDDRMILVVVVAAIIGLAFAVSIPAVRKPVEDLLRVVAFAVPVAVVYVAISHSATTSPVRIHYGLLISFAVAVFVTSCAFHGASVRSRRKAAPRAIRVSNS